ncbi:MAG: conjugative transfer ATPase [Gammaproteobacteria bacterium]|nr:conjugative transfer ATPase [Gammaproteobacteria bacterium]
MKLADFVAKASRPDSGESGRSAGRAPAQAAGAARRPAPRKGVPPATVASMYRPARSFVDHLPWAEALDDGTILLEDGRSVGAAWEIGPRGTEGRGGAWLADVRDGLHDVLQDSFEELDASPWVVQTFTWREPDLSAAAAAFSAYAAEHAGDGPFTAGYAAILADHYRGVAKPGGLFADRLSQTRWAGARQRTVVTLHRWGRDAAPAGEGALVLEAGGKLMGALEGLGVRQRRLTAAEVHAWLTRWFNAWTHLTPDDPAAFAREFLDDGLPYGDAFADSLFYSHPRSDAERGAWLFDKTAMRVLTVEGLRRPPAIGHVTGETRHGDAVNAVLDQLPEGTVYVTTLVPVPQDTVDAHVDRIASSATGESADAMRARADCRAAKEIMGERHKLYRLGVAFHLRAASLEDLDARTAEARTVLLRHGFRAIAPKDDVRALDNFLLHLPMAYDPDVDRKAGWRQTRLAWVQHAANVWPVFGRSAGTGHPGLSFFNRGGEPLTFDPLNKLDRLKNAHGLLVGPTGAGKSATLGGMLAQLMAVHRPRLFVIEAGNSFGLLADWFESRGLSVNRVALRPGSGVSLPTFADAALLPEAAEVALDTDTPEDAELPEFGDVEDDDEDEPRDILGELETVATLMVTGGEAKEVERLRRADRRVIRDAVIEAAKNARAEGAMPRTEHVRRAFHLLAETREGLLDEARQRLRDMGDAIGLFCDGFAGEVFNRDGDIWPEADVTLVDLAHFAREGYEAHLAIALISLLNVVNNIAERDQRTGREIVVAIDEAHIVTTHPLVSPYLVKIVKMWRERGGLKKINKYTRLKGTSARVPTNRHRTGNALPGDTYCDSGGSPTVRLRRPSRLPALLLPWCRPCSGWPTNVPVAGRRSPPHGLPTARRRFLKLPVIVPLRRPDQGFRRANVTVR